MASMPYSVVLTIQYPSGTDLDNVNVTVRVESTNESKSLTTNSAGEVIFNLGSSDDFPSGYHVGDIISYVVMYTGYEAYGSHVIAAGGYTATVVLTAVPTAPSLKLFNPQEFFDYFNVKTYEVDAENGIKAQQVVKIGEMVEKGIENDADFTFDDNDGAYYSATEYIDTYLYQLDYHLKNLPVSSVTNAYTTQSDEEAAPDYTNNTTNWNSLTEGTDFVINKGNEGTGRLLITNSSYYPLDRRWGLYVVYKYGRTSVPDDIKQLAILETGLKLLGATVVRSKVKGSEKDTGDLSWFTNYRKMIIGSYAVGGKGSLNT